MEGRGRDGPFSSFLVIFLVGFFAILRNAGHCVHAETERKMYHNFKLVLIVPCFTCFVIK